MPRFRFRGFTILELMVTLTVLGILLGVAVPSFSTFVQNSRVTSQTNELVSALNLARSEAIRRGGTATVEAVSASGFAGGWCVHVGSGCADTGNVLRVYPAMTRLAVESSATSITFDSRGARRAPAAASVTVTIEPDDCETGAAGRARRLEIALTGRITLQRIDC